ncbi:hypothetical protein PGTUg99_015711 [Puccinia graminis f. sp. tritici]|uniref:Uncharacterized protein n=1 Tax=Puccinia graminis f. sp. tritici TaxID=56615 RepID=A0A5B0RMA0_PUCGR|nr:hypothetical protein PGTUg99_015711 [Puccinia graminis f. sp. tritici]
MREGINHEIGTHDSIKNQVKSKSMSIQASKSKVPSHVPTKRELDTLCQNVKNQSIAPAGSQKAREEIAKPPIKLIKPHIKLNQDKLSLRKQKTISHAIDTYNKMKISDEGVRQIIEDFSILEDESFAARFLANQGDEWRLKWLQEHAKLKQAELDEKAKLKGKAVLKIM